MAYYKFTKAIMDGDPIDVYNNGIMTRDFTYIDDIVEGVARVINFIPKREMVGTVCKPPYSLYNIGNNKPTSLAHFIETLEFACQKKAIKNYLPMQPGDVPVTYADVDSLTSDVGFRPNTRIEEGLMEFVKWYEYYYNYAN